MDVPDRNLVLVDDPRLRAPRDFLEIRERVEQLAPDIEVFIIPNGHLSPVTSRRAGRRPTLVFCPDPVREFRPQRGVTYQGRPLPKSTQVAMLVRAGLSVPRSVKVTPTFVPSSLDWGPFTVLKPENARQGQGVRLVRTRDVKWVDPLSWPRTDPRHGRPMIAQQFIDTGLHASSYRVNTVFGRLAYSLASIALEERPTLDPNGNEPVDIPIASNAGARRLEMNFREDVLRLGCAVYAACPTVPVHGVDIVREAETGRLFVLEFNPTGLTWHMSSPYAAHHRGEFNLDLYSQFGALASIADALIEKTRTEAV